MRDFNHSVNVLVKAYLNNTLEHNNCHACAVGNLIADAKGISLVKRSDTSGKQYNKHYKWLSDKYPEWYGYIRNNNFVDHQQAIEEIQSTGYSVDEIIQIEHAFEYMPGRSKWLPWDTLNDERMFNGLMAVVDVLADIHGIDLKQREEAKALFVK